MIRTALLSVFSALLLCAAPAGAVDYVTFVPPNDMKIPVGSPYARGIIEGQFHEVLDIVQRLYAPIVAARGGVLQINRKWTDPTVNASASQQGGKYILNMYGGLARHETITMDGFALVACHELGHHLGGAPKMGGYSGAWATNEGQSDYYSTLKCLRMVFSDSAASAFTRMSEGDEVAMQSCEAAHSDQSERELCVRGAMAGKSVAYLFKVLRNETVEPRFDTPSQTVVTAMLDKHPPTQCRMDTYLQGALCAQPVSAEVSNHSPVPGTCTLGGGFRMGMRPFCWYKPATSAEFVPDFFKEGPSAALPAVPGRAFSAIGTLPW